MTNETYAEQRVRASNLRFAANKSQKSQEQAALAKALENWRDARLPEGWQWPAPKEPDGGDTDGR